MASKPSSFSDLLQKLSLPITLSLAATLLSGNVIQLFNGWELFNDWDWFNNSFNRVTQIFQPEAPAPESEPGSTSELFTPSISIEVAPNFNVTPGDVNVWQQVVPGDGPLLNINPHQQVNPTLHNQPSIQLTPLPVPPGSWTQPQSVQGAPWLVSLGSRVALSLDRDGQGAIAGNFVGTGVAGTGSPYFPGWRRSGAGGQGWGRTGRSSQTAIAAPLSGANQLPALFSAPPEGVLVATADPWGPIPKVTPAPAPVTVPEPGLVFTLGAVGVTLLGRVTLK